jgi:hypothetical protein
MTYERGKTMLILPPVSQTKIELSATGLRAQTEGTVLLIGQDALLNLAWEFGRFYGFLGGLAGGCVSGPSRGGDPGYRQICLWATLRCDSR